jgi:DNA-binding winged helix-turn-helix (wHTH) protein
MSKTFLVFPPFRLDVGDERLWKGSSEIGLRRKPFAILRYIAEHPQRLVSQEELVKEIWGNIVVSESAIRTQLYDLRHAVGEGIIETVVGRGYRSKQLLDEARPQRPQATRRRRTLGLELLRARRPISWATRTRSAVPAQRPRSVPQGCHGHLTRVRQLSAGLPPILKTSGARGNSSRDA